ncbi:protein FAM228B-like isoform X2 [Haliotis rufescens]|uniref:protein FAM228B-like isoform X2 n=1 Tax=Haliotis rufescens TaxID=6454 RepID=UPI00201EE47B|nr:protein FAM228B-like isoform X2 [Haliotis rufescens]
MSSLLCVQQPGGSVKIHSEDLVQELTQDKDAPQLHIMSASRCRRSSRRSNSSVSNHRQPGSNGVDSKSLIGQSLKIQDWLNEKTVKDLQEKSDSESKSVKKLYGPLLEAETTFVKEVDEYLEDKDLLDLRKKELLHKKWNDQVYEPLRKEIIDVMDGYDWPDLDRRKREMHKQYLEFLNDKVETAALRDPLLSQGRERNMEERTILRCMTGTRYTDRDLEQVKLPPLPLVPLGRHGTDSLQWLQMPLVNIESSPRQISRRRMHGHGTTSLLNFEEWAKQSFDPRVVDQELQCQKKRMFKVTPPYNTVPVEVPRPPMIMKQDRGEHQVVTKCI